MKRFDRHLFAWDARELARQKIPFRDQGCNPETGVDCINLLRVLYQKQGFSLPEEMEQAFKAYHPRTNGKEMFRLMLKWLIEIPIEEASVGDIYLFRDKFATRHTAVKVTNEHPPLIVEAYAHGLTESPLDFLRFRLIVAAFRIPEGLNG